MCIQVTRVGTGFFGEYFDVDYEGNMRRTCASRRELIQDHVDTSMKLRAYVYESVVTAPEQPAGVRRWRLLNNDGYESERVPGSTTCRGVSKCDANGGMCGCTQVGDTQLEVLKAITPATLAVTYAKSTGALQIQTNRFMAPYSLNMNLELAVVKYSMLDLDAGGYVQVSDALVEALVGSARELDGSIFADLTAASHCLRNDMLDPAQVSANPLKILPISVDPL